MNERIKQLVKKAGGDFMVTFADDTETRPSKVVSVDFDPPETLEKFAELIVRQCAAITSNTNLEDVDGGDSAVLGAAREQILKHFGIEE